jgi:hypothetical protein
MRITMEHQIANRRHAIAGMAAVLGVAALSGCAGATAAVTEAVADASKVVATVSVDLTAIANDYATAKGIGEAAIAVLTITDPGAALALTAAFKLGDAAVVALPTIEAGAALLASTASTLVSQTLAILAAAAPGFDAVAKAL